MNDFVLINKNIDWFLSAIPLKSWYSQADKELDKKKKKNGGRNCLLRVCWLGQRWTCGQKDWLGGKVSVWRIWLPFSGARN